MSIMLKYIRITFRKPLKKRSVGYDGQIFRSPRTHCLISIPYFLFEMFYLITTKQNKIPLKCKNFELRHYINRNYSQIKYLTNNIYELRRKCRYMTKCSLKRSVFSGLCIKWENVSHRTVFSHFLRSQGKRSEIAPTSISNRGSLLNCVFLTSAFFGSIWKCYRINIIMFWQNKTFLQ